jgi:flagellar hook-associated protein 2
MECAEARSESFSGRQQGGLKMSTSSVTPTSTTSSSGSAASTTTVTPLTFNGQSKFSSSFQNIIDKYVSLQSTQLNALTNLQAADQKQLSALQTINNDFNSLQTSVNALATAIGADSFTGSVSDSSLASVTVGDDAAAGTFTLEIDSLGVATQTISTAGQTVTNPNSESISAATSFTLSINNVPTTITPTNATLNGLADAINAAGLGVSANIVNDGSTASPDYRLSVQSTTLADDDIQLTDSSNTQYLTTLGQGGSPATYKVDGLPTVISSDSNTITLSPGITVNLLAETPSGSPLTVTVQQTTDAASTALANFATAYNQINTDLDAQHGINAGALSGSSILQVAHQAMEAMGLYADGNGNGLVNAGLDLDPTGNLTFDPTNFSQYLGSNVQGLAQFLGDSTQGFIAAANNAISGLTDFDSGILTAQENTLNSNISNLTTSISDQVSTINTNQQSLFQQLAASDATIYSLTNQVTYFQDMFFPNASSTSS